MGFDRVGKPRLEAGIKHVLSASREQGHCYLTEDQIFEGTNTLLNESLERERVCELLSDLLLMDQIKRRELLHTCYYSKSLYFDELSTSDSVQRLLGKSIPVERGRIEAWVQKYCKKEEIQLSDEQEAAVVQIPARPFSILTGGPGCGKTTCTKVLVQLLRAMKKKVLLAAPTGRAAQRMSEVIGLESKTIHRLLEWAPNKNGFKRDEKDPLEVDFLIVDETSMLDISLASSLLRAVPTGAQVLFIGDPDQLPAVGAGNVLNDLLMTTVVPRFRLTKVFRQAQSSSIIRFAHEINSGVVPKVLSPLAMPKAFSEGHDCLFVDAEEASQEQIRFLRRAKLAIEQTVSAGDQHLLKSGESWVGRMQLADDELIVDRLYRPEDITEESIRRPVLTIPEKYKHVDLAQLAAADSGPKELMALLQSVHPWSSLHFGLAAVETVVRLYTKTIPDWLGAGVEIQILTPQVRGTLGTMNLNESLQKIANPESASKSQIQVGAKIFRVGDRVIQTRNNYDLGVFNGDIGRIIRVDTADLSCTVEFMGGDHRVVEFSREDLSELALAYAITIHKSQGSEFSVVIIPVLGQHFNMLFRNLIYTGLTRAKKLAIFVGSRRAFARAIGQIDNRQRQTALTELVENTQLMST